MRLGPGWAGNLLGGDLCGRGSVGWREVCGVGDLWGWGPVGLGTCRAEVRLGWGPVMLRPGWAGDP